MKIKAYIYVFLLVPFLGCSSLNVQRAQADLRQKMESHDTMAAVESVEKSIEKGYYTQKDEVLVQLELGTTAYFNKQFEKSINAFREAEDRMDELVTRSAKRGAASIVGNDNQLDYDGTDFEQLYVNAFNALNYLHIYDLEGALVETRKMIFKLDEMQRKFSVEPSIEVNQENQIDWNSPEMKNKLGNFQSRIRNSAWVRYLATLIYAKNNDIDDARIEFQNLDKALAIQQDLAWGDFPQDYELDPILDPTSYNTLLIAYTGPSPSLNSVEYRDLIPVDNDGDLNEIYIKYALPVMNLAPINAAYVDVKIDNMSPIRLPLIEHTDEIRMQFFDRKKATIYARALARSTAKTIGVEALKKAVKRDEEDDEDDEDEDLGAQIALEAAASIFGFLYKEGSEQADLRSWQSLPSKIHATTLKLAPGIHRLEYAFYSINEELIDTRYDVITIQPTTATDQQLNVSEVFLWN